MGKAPPCPRTAAWRTPDEAGPEKKPEEPDLRGRYVEGNYGKAGAQSGRHADDEEGNTSKGTTGGRQRRRGLPEPLGDKAKESGRYVKANFGDAGSTPGRTAESEIGQYPEGNLERAIPVDPVRKPHTDTDTGTGTDKQE